MAGAALAAGDSWGWPLMPMNSARVAGLDMPANEPPLMRGRLPYAGRGGGGGGGGDVGAGGGQEEAAGAFGGFEVLSGGKLEASAERLEGGPCVGRRVGVV